MFFIIRRKVIIVKYTLEKQAYRLIVVVNTGKYLPLLASINDN